MRERLKTNAALWIAAAAGAFVTALALLRYNSAVSTLWSAGIIGLCLWLALCLFYRAVLNRLSRRLFFVSLAGGALFAALQTAGNSILHGFGPELVPILFFGHLLLFFSCFVLAFSFLEAWQKMPPRPLSSFGRKLECLLKPSGKAFFALAGILFLCWLPYYIIGWPGFVSLDVKTQIDYWFTGQILAHHPIIHTAFLGVFAQMGQAVFGSAIAGIGVASFLQMLALIFVLAVGLCAMARLGVGLWWRFGIFLFYALFPMFALYAVTLWKDVWLAAFTLLFYLCLVALCRCKAAFFHSKKHVAVLAVAALGMLLSKNNGIHMFILSLVAVLVFQKGTRVKTGVVLLCGLIFWMLWEGPVYALLGVRKGDVREALSVPMLQVARVVRDDPKGISAEDEALIRSVLPYDELGEQYNPNISDSIKKEFDSQVFEQNPGTYLRLWLRLGLEYPVLYLHSFMEQTYGYWYPNVWYWIYSDEPYTGNHMDPATRDWVVEEPPAAVRAVNAAMAQIRVIPGFSMLQSVGFYFWLLAAAALYAVYTRQRGMLPPLALFFAVWLVCLASPVFAEFRYAWPAIFSAPVALGLVFGRKAVSTHAGRDCVWNTPNLL